MPCAAARSYIRCCAGERVVVVVVVGRLVVVDGREFDQLVDGAEVFGGVVVVFGGVDGFDDPQPPPVELRVGLDDRGELLEDREELDDRDELELRDEPPPRP